MYWGISRYKLEGKKQGRWGDEGREKETRKRKGKRKRERERTGRQNGGMVG